MSEIGYYRYKLNNLPVGLNSVPLYKNGGIEVTHIVDVRKWEDGQKLIKYLDRNGQYRYYIFNCRYETRDKPKLIGTANKTVLSILSSQSDSDNIGYKNERSISLVADNVSDEDLEYLQDIWVSPRVYLHIGETNEDTDQYWLQVTVSNSDSVAKRRRLNFGKLNLEITLPEWHAVKMI